MNEQMDRRDALKVLGAAATVPLLGSSVSQPLETEDFKDAFARMSSRERVMAILRENQRKHNPSLIPQMEKLFADTHLWDWVSIQPATGEEALAYSIQYRGEDGKPFTGSPFEKELTLTIESVSLPIDRRKSQNTLETRDVERLVLNEIRKLAHKMEWNFGLALGDTILEKYESLYIKLVEMSNVIHRSTLRGGANRIVTSPEISAIFETSHGGLEPSDLSELAKVGIVKVGTVNNRWYLYKDPLWPVKNGIVKVGTVNNRWYLYKDPLWPVKNGPILTFYAGNKAHLDRGCVFMPLHLEDENTLRYGISVKPEYAGIIEVQNFI